MTARDISSLSNSNAKSLLEKSEEKAFIAQWKIYIRQQMILTRQRLIQSSFSVAFEVSRRNDKFYHIKTIEQTFAFYIEKFYAEWISHIRVMKSQFKINQCDRFADDSNSAKFVYVEIFLKRKITIHMLWEIDVIAKSNEKRIWIEYKNFLKINVQKIFIKIENIYDKYLNYKQINKQFVMNYDVNRIVFMIQFTSKLKLNNHEKFQNFIKELLSKHRRFLAKKRDMHIKIEIFNRFKKIENVDYQNSQHNKQKVIEININNDFNKRKKNDDNLINEKKQFNKKSKLNNNDNENSNDSEKNDKKFKFDNFNRDSIKFKLYRWIKVEFAVIKKNEKCFECDKDDHDINACINKKKCTVFAESLLEIEKTKN